MKRPLVIFFELKNASKNRCICDIVEKLYDSNISVTIFSNDKKNAAQLDDLLWTWKQDSFIPHSIAGLTEDSNPVTINLSGESLSKTQALILADPLPVDSFSFYDLIIDFAEVYHSDKKQESRSRYKLLRDSEKFDLHFLQLGAFLAKEKISLNKTQ
jgi:DNA polymerase III subunit chi